MYGYQDFLPNIQEFLDKDKIIIDYKLRFNQDSHSLVYNSKLLSINTIYFFKYILWIKIEITVTT